MVTEKRRTLYLSARVQRTRLLQAYFICAIEDLHILGPFYSVEQQPKSGLGRQTVDVSRSQKILGTHIQPVG